MAKRYKSYSSSSSSSSSNIGYHGIMPFLPDVYPVEERREAYVEYCPVSEIGFEFSKYAQALSGGNISPVRLGLFSSLYDLAKLALDHYNNLKKNHEEDTKYEFVRVVMANSEQINYLTYYITFEGKPISSSSRNRNAAAAAAAASLPGKLFQAEVSCGLKEYTVHLCRPEPTHFSETIHSYAATHNYYSYGSASWAKHNNDNFDKLSDEDSKLYAKKCYESYGFDVPEFPNSSRVLDLIRPVKLTEDNIQMFNDLSKRAVDHYNCRYFKDCEFVKVIRVNEQDAYDTIYYITLEVRSNNPTDTFSQIAQAKVLCPKGDGPDEPYVKFCRDEPQPRIFPSNVHESSR